MRNAQSTSIDLPWSAARRRPCKYAPDNTSMGCWLFQTPTFDLADFLNLVTLQFLQVVMTATCRGAKLNAARSTLWPPSV